jgi:cation/acetate symporter
VAKVEGKTTSLMGLAKPLFTLKNPGIISIPLGFLAVLLGSLMFPDRRSLAMWPEVYARQNTGILVSKASSH